MKYRNIMTGTVIDVECEISGQNWEPVEAPGSPLEEKTAKPSKKKAKNA